MNCRGVSYTIKWSDHGLTAPFPTPNIVYCCIAWHCCFISSLAVIHLLYVYRKWARAGAICGWRWGWLLVSSWLWGEFSIYSNSRCMYWSKYKHHGACILACAWYWGVSSLTYPAWSVCCGLIYHFNCILYSLSLIPSPRKNGLVHTVCACARMYGKTVSKCNKRV